MKQAAEKRKQTVKRLMSNTAASERSEEAHELLRLVTNVGVSAISSKAMTPDDALAALHAATVSVALRVMKPADIAAWLRRTASDIEAEVKSGAGKPS